MGDLLDLFELDAAAAPTISLSSAPEPHQVPAHWPPPDSPTLLHVTISARCSVDYLSNDDSGLLCYYSAIYSANRQYDVNRMPLVPYDLAQILNHMGGGIAGYSHERPVPVGLERALIKGVMAVLDSLRVMHWHPRQLLIRITSPDWMEKLRDPIVACGETARGLFGVNAIVPNAWLWKSMVQELRKVVLELGTDVHFQLTPEAVRAQQGYLEGSGITMDVVEPRLNHWVSVRGYVERGPIQWLSFWKSQDRVAMIEGYEPKPWYAHS